MTHPYVPPQPGGPGAYEQQLAARCRRLEQENLQLRRDRDSLENEAGEYRRRLDSLRRQVQEIANERDQLAAGAVLVCSDERHQAKVAGLETALAEAEARIADLQQDDGDWLTGVLYARKLSVCWDEPLVSPAFTGDKPQPSDHAEPPTLTARHLSYPRPACPGCEWAAHQPFTCDEVAAFRTRFDGLVAEGLEEVREERATGQEMVATDMSMFLAQQAAGVHRARIQAEAAYVQNSLLFGPETAITFDGLAAVIDECRATEQRAVPRRKVQRSETSSTGLTVVTTDPVQEIAAEPATLEKLQAQFFTAPASRLGAQVGQIGNFFGFPLIPDQQLPPGEVHMRPHPRGES